MKRFLKTIITITLVFSLYIPNYFSEKTVSAEGTNLSLNDDSLVDWMLDKNSNTIIAITKNGNLHFISADTLTITKSLTVGLNPSDLARQGDHLYVSLPDVSKIEVVDLLTKTISEEITTVHQPYQVAASPEKLFYSDKYEVYDLNLSTKQETDVVLPGDVYTSFSSPELFVEDTTNTLYIAESRVSASNVYALSTSDYSLKDETTYDDGYGFQYPDRHFQIDGQDVFFAGNKLNKGNLEEIYGVYADDYGSKENTINAADILAVDNQYVYSEENVFDRSTFTKVGTVSEGVTHIITNGDSRYMYNENDHTIRINHDTYSHPSVTSSLTNNKLFLNEEIDKWVLDAVNNRIYAISESNNELIYIDTTTMSVVGRQMVGSIPSDIDYVNGKLYITLSGSTKIAIVGTTPGGPIQYINTLQNPFEIEINGNDLYYVTEDQWTYLYHVDLSASTENRLIPEQSNLYSYYEPDLYLDKDQNVLYLGESGSSGSSLFVINPSDGTHLNKTDYNNGYGFSYPIRTLKVDDDSIYYAGYKLQKSDVKVEEGKYFDNDEDIVALSGNYLFSNKKIYDKNTQLPIVTFPEDISINAAGIDTNGNIYLSVPDKKAVYKFKSLEDLKSRLVKNLGVSFDSSNQFKTSWDLMTGDGYKLYAKKDGETLFTSLNKNPILAQAYTATDEQLKSWYGHTVTFGVKSLFGTGESTSMNTVEHTFEIPFPTNVQSSFTEVPDNLKPLYGDKFFKVEWNPVSLIDGYNLYYNTDDNPTKKMISITDPNDTNVSFTNDFFDTWAGNTVYFEITSVVNSKESAPSQKISYTFVKDDEGNTTVPGENPDPSNIPVDNDVNQPEESTTEDENTQQNPSPVGTVVDSPSDSSDDVNEDNQTPTSSDVDNEDNHTSTSTGKVVKVKTKKEGSTIVISKDHLDELENGADVVVDLKDNDDDTSDVLFTDDWIKKLIEKGSVLSIQKVETTVSIPSSVFEGKVTDTKITITRVQTVEGALSDAFDFTIWQGKETISEFLEPVLLSFNIDPSLVKNPEKVKVYYWNEEEDGWELIGGTYKDGVITAETNHFSTYAVFEKTPRQLVKKDVGSKKTTSDSTKQAMSYSNSDSSSKSKFDLIWIPIVAAVALIVLIIVYFRRKRMSA